MQRLVLLVPGQCDVSQEADKAADRETITPVEVVEIWILNHLVLALQQVAAPYQTLFPRKIFCPSLSHVMEAAAKRHSLAHINRRPPKHCDVLVLRSVVRRDL